MFQLRRLTETTYDLGGVDVLAVAVADQHVLECGLDVPLVSGPVVRRVAVGQGLQPFVHQGPALGQLQDGLHPDPALGDPCLGLGQQFSRFVAR